MSQPTVEDVATLRIAYFDEAEGTYDEAVVEIMELPIGARYVASRIGGHRRVDFDS